MAQRKKDLVEPRFPGLRGSILGRSIGCALAHVSTTLSIHQVVYYIAGQDGCKARLDEAAAPTASPSLVIRGIVGLTALTHRCHSLDGCNPARTGGVHATNGHQKDQIRRQPTLAERGQRLSAG